MVFIATIFKEKNSTLFDKILGIGFYFFKNYVMIRLIFPIDYTKS